MIIILADKWKAKIRNTWNTIIRLSQSNKQTHFTLLIWRYHSTRFRGSFFHALIELVNEPLRSWGYIPVLPISLFTYLHLPYQGQWTYSRELMHCNAVNYILFSVSLPLFHLFLSFNWLYVCVVYLICVDYMQNQAFHSTSVHVTLMHVQLKLMNDWAVGAGVADSDIWTIWIFSGIEVVELDGDYHPGGQFWMGCKGGFMLIVWGAESKVVFRQFELRCRWKSTLGPMTTIELALKSCGKRTVLAFNVKF